MIRFLCPSCGQKLKAAPQYAGRTIACTNCQRRLEVPGDLDPEPLAAPEIVDEPTPAPQPEPVPKKKKKKKKRPTGIRSGRASDYSAGRRQAWVVIGLLLALEAFNVGGLFVLEYAMKRRAQQLLGSNAGLGTPQALLRLGTASQYAWYGDDDDDPADGVVFPMQPGRPGSPAMRERGENKRALDVKKIDIDLNDDENDEDASFQRLKSWISLAVRLTIAFFLTLGHEWARTSLAWIMGLSLGLDFLSALFLIKLTAVFAPLAGTGVFVAVWVLVVGTMLIEAGILTFLLTSYSLRVYCGSD